jgi:TAZ zinc finger
MVSYSRIQRIVESNSTKRKAHVIDDLDTADSQPSDNRRQRLVERDQPPPPVLGGADGSTQASQPPEHVILGLLGLLAHCSMCNKTQCDRPICAYMKSHIVHQGTCRVRNCDRCKAVRELIRVSFQALCKIQFIRDETQSYASHSSLPPYFRYTRRRARSEVARCLRAGAGALERTL